MSMGGLFHLIQLPPTVPSLRLAGVNYPPVQLNGVCVSVCDGLVTCD